jgi:hypothetical protein
LRLPILVFRLPVPAGGGLGLGAAAQAGTRHAEAEDRRAPSGRLGCGNYNRINDKLRRGVRRNKLGARKSYVRAIRIYLGSACGASSKARRSTVGSTRELKVKVPGTDELFAVLTQFRMIAD